MKIVTRAWLLVVLVILALNIAVGNLWMALLTALFTLPVSTWVAWRNR